MQCILKTQSLLQVVTFNAQLVGNETFSVDPQSGSIAPGKTCKLQFALQPSFGVLRSRVPLTINGLYSISLEVKANVITRRLTLADRSLQKLSLGPVHVGKNRRECVELVNRAPISAKVDFSGCLDVLKQQGVHIEPPTLTLAAKQRKQFQITFRPQARCASFRVAVPVKVSGLVQHLMTLSGSALGIDAHLDTSSVPFGTVVIGSQTTHVVRLRNNGESVPFD
jgi:Abnormal spindle-like microcephaly-assoc'd, ASPM-SPD-2-Hydin